MQPPPHLRVRLVSKKEKRITVLNKTVGAVYFVRRSRLFLWRRCTSTFSRVQSGMCSMEQIRKELPKVVGAIDVSVEFSGIDCVGRVEDFDDHVFAVGQYLRSWGQESGILQNWLWCWCTSSWRSWRFDDCRVPRMEQYWWSYECRRLTCGRAVFHPIGERGIPFCK